MGEANANPQSAQYKGPDVVLDARGRPLRDGDEVILSISGPIYLRVMMITPVLDPAAPPGLLQVHLGTIFPLTTKRGIVNGGLIRVREAEEAGPLPFQITDIGPRPQ